MDAGLFDLGEDEGRPAPPWSGVVPRAIERRDVPGGELATGIVEALEREPHLLEVARAGGTVGRLACGLHGRQQEPDERADDRDHHQELDEREGSRTSRIPAEACHGAESGGTRMVPVNSGAS
jgi:hypothetical protein